MTNEFYKVFIGLVLLSLTTLHCSNPRPSDAVSSEAIELPAAKIDEDKPIQKNNLVLVVIDSLRYDRISRDRNGVPFMPKLRDLASRSLFFENAFTQATWTKPAVTSIMTSLYPEVHKTLYGVTVSLGIDSQTTVDGLPENIEPMAELLKKNGFSTVAIQTNINLNESSGLSRGFDEYVVKPYPGCTATETTDLALTKLRTIQKPFFLYVHYMDPHHPYSPPERYHTVFETPPELNENDRQLLEGFSEGYYLDKVLFEIGIKPSRNLGDLSADGKKYVELMYDGEVRYTDDELDRLVQEITTQFPNTFIMITADHGEEFWEHGSIGHSKTVYEELAHVPLLLYGPGIQKERVSRPVELIDILPTVASLLDIARSDLWQGISLLNSDQDASLRPIFIETRGSLREANLFLRAIQLGQKKLVRNVSRNEDRFYKIGSSGFDEEITPDPHTETKLREILEHHISANAQHPLFESQTVENEISDEIKEQLRRIGYLH